MIKNYFRLAWRQLQKNKLISAINIFGLATGLSAALLMIIWVQNELSFDTIYKNYRQTYLLTSTGQSHEGKLMHWDSQTYILGKLAAQETPGIESLTRAMAISETKVMKVGDHSFYEKKAAYIDENWFEIFDQRVLKGNVQEFFSNPFSVALTSAKAKLLFGNAEAVGKLIAIDSVQYMVRVVVENNKPNASMQFEMMLPLAAALTNPEERKASMSWNSSGYVTFVKLKNGARSAQVANSISAIRDRNTPAKFPAPDRISLLPLRDLHFTETNGSVLFVKGNRRTVIVFGILAALVLFSACINYVNLTTARAVRRSREVGIRKIIGARKSQVFLLFLVESITVTMIAVGIALFAVQMVLPAFNSLTEKQFTFPFLQGKFWVMVGGTAVIVTALNGIYPSLFLSAFKPVNAVHGSGVFSLSHGLLRKVLVVVQFSFSIALISATIILTKQLRFINERDTGFNRSLVFQMPMPYAAFENMDLRRQESIVSEMRESIAENASVDQVSIATPGIGDTQVYFTGEVDWPGKNSAFNPKVSPFWADDHFFKLFKLKLSEGRWLRNDKADAKNVVINETAVQELGLKSPVSGQSFTYLRDTGIIVGVVKDIQYKSMHEKIGPQIFKQNENAGTLNLYVKPGIGQTAAAVEVAKKAWKNHLPSYPFVYSFVEDNYAEIYAAERKSATITTMFSFLAVIISCFGLLGLATFSAEARAKEISIRKVLGASFANILALLSRDFVWLITIAALIAFPIAYYFGGKWLQNFAYRINIGWEIFGTAGLLALFVAFGTVSIQTVKAAIRNPVKTMRGD